jgi:hypothetical protein
MVFPYIINTNIPDAPNDPADDQPIMKQNYANIAGFLAVDHVAAGTNPGAGFHAKVTINDVAAPAAPIDPVSVMYTAAGTASTVADLRFRNANAIFPISALKACCVFVPDTAGVGTFYVPLNQFNIATIQKTIGLTYTVTFTTNAVNSVDFIPTITVQNGAGVTYTTAANSIIIVTTAGIQSSQSRISLLIHEI